MADKKGTIVVVVLSIIGIIVLYETRRSHSGEILGKTFQAVSTKSDGVYTGYGDDGDTYLIPSDAVLGQLTGPELFDVYWNYINTAQVLCRNQMRVGSVKDGGKEVCIDRAFNPKLPCLVYSFGSNNKFDFEEAVFSRFKCEIHTFDPSRGKNQWKIPNYVTFHDVGLAGTDEKNKAGWQLNTLGTTIKSLKHDQSIIDILKFDIEGSEWTALPEMITNGSLRNVKQMCVEFHYKPSASPQVQAGFLKVFRQLYDHGFHIFQHDRNPVSIVQNKTPLNELSFVNVNIKRDHHYA